MSYSEGVRRNKETHNETTKLSSLVPNYGLEKLLCQSLPTLYLSGLSMFFRDK